MAAALAVLAAGAFAQKQQVMLDKVVAVVGSSSILYSEVADHARQLTAQRRAEGYTSDRDPMNEALEALMTQKLLFNQAQIDSVKINAGDIASHVEEQVQNMIEAEGSIPRLEAKHHMAIFNIRENMRQRYEEQSYASSMQNEVVSKVAVIPGEVERFYKSIDKDSLPTIAEQYVYAQITRFPKSITQAKQRTRERLLDMRERVITGKAKFENLARMYSQDPGTMMRGGEMDPAPLASLDSSFAAALENMKPGQISEVVESQFGFHIIQMLDKRGESLPFPPYPAASGLYDRRAYGGHAFSGQHRQSDPQGFDHLREGRAALFRRCDVEDERRYRFEPRHSGAFQRFRRQADRDEVPARGFRPLQRAQRLQRAGAAEARRGVGSFS